MHQRHQIDMGYTRSPSFTTCVQQVLRIGPKLKWFLRLLRRKLRRSVRAPLLKDKRNGAYVNGGMLAQDEIDSMNLQHGYCLESMAKHRTARQIVFLFTAKQSAGVALPRVLLRDSLDEKTFFSIASKTAATS
ncbi:hypothetical protein GQ600_4975 [Phytophthora cactorum]|nr:hypothetical protein GQ600_4975 [Phytophthora cactorum]